MDERPQIDAPRHREEAKRLCVFGLVLVCVAPVVGYVPLLIGAVRGPLPRSLNDLLVGSSFLMGLVAALLGRRAESLHPSDAAGSVKLLGVAVIVGTMLVFWLRALVHGASWDL